MSKPVREIMLDRSFGLDTVLVYVLRPDSGVSSGFTWLHHDTITQDSAAALFGVCPGPGESVEVRVFVGDRIRREDGAVIGLAAPPEEIRGEVDDG